MRALVCKKLGAPNEVLDVVETDDPSPSDGEVLVEIHAAGINFPDMLEIAGHYQVKSDPPFVPGNEGAGKILAVGSKVRNVSVGDSVIVFRQGGMFAEKCVVDARQVFPMPQSLSFEQAAGFTITYSTSYHALKQSARLQAGETMLVLGAAGGVGITAVEIGKAMGARVIAAASTDEKLAFAKNAGADETINYVADDLKDAVRALTDGRGADVVYDPVGGDLAETALRATAWHGRFLVIGFASGKIPGLPANLALLKEASIVGVFWGAWAARNPAEQQQNVLEMAQLIEAGALEPRVTASYPLEDYAEAFANIAGRKVMGKSVFRMH